MTEGTQTKRNRPSLSALAYRSRVTNGTALFVEGVDGNTPWARRFRDLLASHEADLGGRDHLSEGQRAITRRVAMITLQLELLEQTFAENEGHASPAQLANYQRASNTLRRLLEALGLHLGRLARQVPGTRRAIQILEQHRA